MRVIGIDPGLKHVGVAVVDARTQELLVARLVDLTDLNTRTASGCVQAALRVRDAIGPGDFIKAYLEKMVHYAPGAHADPNKNVNPNDLIALAYLTGVIMFPLSQHSPVLVTPQKWKGQVPKPVMQRRLEKRWPEECKAVSAGYGKLAHNVFDAMGIALYGAKKEKKR